MLFRSYYVFGRLRKKENTSDTFFVNTAFFSNTADMAISLLFVNQNLRTGRPEHEIYNFLRPGP